jgi:hypothetical protein
MIAFLLPILARWGVPEPLRKLAAYAALVVGFLALCGLVVGAWALLVHRHDKQVIQTYDATQAAKVTATELQAEQTADTNDAARQQTRAVQAKDLNDARDEAIRSKPDETAKPSGPAVSNTLRELRRQAARDKYPAAP